MILHILSLRYGLRPVSQRHSEITRICEDIRTMRELLINTYEKMNIKENYQ